MDFQHLFESSPDLDLLLRADAELTIVAVTDSYLQATATRREEIVGKGLFTLLTDNPGDPERAGIEILRTSLRDVIRTRSVQTIAVQRYDIPQPEGGGFEERYWSAVNTPVLDASGEVLYIRHRISDVTAHMLPGRHDEAESEVRNGEQPYRALAEEAVEWRNRYAAAVEASHQLLYDWDPATNALVYGANLENIIGYSPEEMTGGLKRWMELIHPEDREAFSREIERVRATWSPFRLDFRIVHKNGHIVHCEDRGRFFRDSRGEVVRMVGFVADVSDRERHEQALRENEQRLQLAVAIAQMGTFEIDLRTDDVTVNERGREIYGWDAATPLTFSFVQSHFHPDDRDEVMRRVGMALEPAGADEFEVEQRIYRTDGELRWLRVRGRALFEGAGEERRAVRCVGTYLDVTGARNAEQALRRSEERFRDLADNISQLAWMTDATGWIFWYNRRWFEYTGTTLQGMQGWGWRGVHHPDYLEGVEEKFRRAIETGTPWEDTFPLRGADGRYRWFLSRAMPIRDGEGRVVRWFGTNTDITDRREAEAALREREERLARLNAELAFARDEAVAASAAKSVFLANMSHELRTPLNAIIGYAEMLRDDASHDSLQPDRLVEDLEKVRSAGQHLLGLISGVLDLSKIEAGRMELADEPLDVAQAIQEAVATVAPQAAAHNNRIHSPDSRTDDSAGPVVVRGDSLRFKQVMINLLSNAAKFTENGDVTVRYRVEEQGGQRCLLVSVSDTGVGIARDQLPLVFEKFRQVDSSSTRRHGGSGLGLAISRRLIELMGGQISVESEPGRGSTFTVRLPVAGE